jgi:hypothetical protein
MMSALTSPQFTALIDQSGEDATAMELLGAAVHLNRHGRPTVMTFAHDPTY